MTLSFPKSEQGKRLTKREKPDKINIKREELRRLRIIKAKIRELDGNACANPYHWPWRRQTVDKTNILKSRIANVLSVHRIEYGSHGGGYTPENGITGCGFCHDCWQKGMTLKIGRKKVRYSAHQAALMTLRRLKADLLPDKFRWDGVLQALETKFGEITR